MPQPTNVLIVDDETELRKSLESDLGEIGFKTFSAENGREALEIVKRNNIDIILSDLNMPEMSGVELLKNLRVIGFYRPFIVLSGYGSRDEAISLLRDGAYTFLAKPVSFDDLKSSLLDASRYAEILTKAKDSIKTKLGVDDKDMAGHIEEAVYALARIKALGQR